jgi:hypothetical protein
VLLTRLAKLDCFAGMFSPAFRATAERRTFLNAARADDGLGLTFPLTFATMGFRYGEHSTQAHPPKWITESRMTTAPVQIFWSHRVTFLVVMCLTFIVLAFVIFTLPKRTTVTVRSSIEIGSAAVGGRLEAVEPPENVARWIPGIYGPAALLAMANKGVSPATLTALQNPSVESIGRSLVVMSTIDPSLEKEAKEFQDAAADLVIKELAPRERALRESIETRMTLATRAADDLEQQIRDDANEIGRFGALLNDLRSQLEKQQENLATLYQRTAVALPAGESAPLEAQIREMHERISDQIKLIGELTVERSQIIRTLAATHRLSAVQRNDVADAKFEKNSFNETRISLPPTLMPATNSTTRRRSLFLLAFAVSLLAGFGVVVMSHNMGVRKI